jgi:hypothetical protein
MAGDLAGSRLVERQPFRLAVTPCSLPGGDEGLSSRDRLAGLRPRQSPDAFMAAADPVPARRWGAVAASLPRMAASRLDRPPRSGAAAGGPCHSSCPASGLEPRRSFRIFSPVGHGTT